MPPLNAAPFKSEEKPGSGFKQSPETPIDYAIWKRSLSAVDRWKLARLTPERLAFLEKLPADAWSTALLSWAPKVGDDLAPEPETRLLMVRLAVATLDQKMIDALICDSSPMVRRAAFRGADEMDPGKVVRSHHKEIAEAIRWDRARKKGSVKIPKDLKDSYLPPLQGLEVDDENITS